jgi:hypothetical protein
MLVQRGRGVVSLWTALWSDAPGVLERRRYADGGTAITVSAVFAVAFVPNGSSHRRMPAVSLLLPLR